MFDSCKYFHNWVTSLHLLLWLSQDSYNTTSHCSSTRLRPVAVLSPLAEMYMISMHKTLFLDAVKVNVALRHSRKFQQWHDSLKLIEPGQVKAVIGCIDESTHAML